MALHRRVQGGDDLSERTVVAVLTGHGLKDPATALSLFGELAPVEANLTVLLDLVGAPQPV